MTESEFDEYLSMVETAAVMGVGLSVGEIIACFAFGRVLSLMWILINAIQILVILGAIWQIKFPVLLTVTFAELKRISWGEYFDDFEIGEWASEALFGEDVMKNDQDD